jgi:GTP-binding protein HflX
VLVEDKLFSTLDPTTRRLDLPSGRAVTLTDTVGFIAKLPHDLVEAFKSTLEEVALADLVVHMVDVAQPDPAAQVEAVRKVLTEVGAAGVPELLVLNKADLVDDLSRARLMRQFPGAPLISAATGEGIDELLVEVAARLPHPDVYLTVVLPFQRGDLLDRAYREGEVLEVGHQADGTRLVVRAPAALAHALGPFAESNASKVGPGPSGQRDAAAGSASSGGPGQQVGSAAEGGPPSPFAAKVVAAEGPRPPAPMPGSR